MIANEYLIRTENGEDYPFDQRGLDKYLIPDSFETKIIPPAYGELGLLINDIEMSFCVEPPGIQVGIEDGEPSEAELNAIFTGIVKKLEETTGLKGLFYPL